MGRPRASVLAAIGLFAPAGFGGFTAGADVAAIRVQRDPDGVVVTGVYEGGGAGPLAYELTVRREGAAGTSATRQSGLFENEPGRAVTVGFVRVNARLGDRVALRLVVRRGEEVVAEAHREGTLPDV